MKIDEVSFTSVSRQCQIGGLKVLQVLQERGIDPASDLQHLTAAEGNLCWPKKQCLSVLVGRGCCARPLPPGICRVWCCVPSYVRSLLAVWIWRAGYRCLVPGGRHCQGLASQGQPKVGFTTKYYSQNSFSWAAGWTRSAFRCCGS